MCHLVLFRHAVKTGGTTLRSLFLTLAGEADGSRYGGAGWRAAVPYADQCSSFHGWRRYALIQWMDDRRAGRSEGPNIFLEYHVASDGAYDFYEDLEAARAAQSSRCTVLAVTLVRQPEVWIRSMFKHDLRLYLRRLGKAPESAETCGIATRLHAVWQALGRWQGTRRSHVRPYADYDARMAINSTLHEVDLTLWSDDDTTNHTNSQSNALFWRVQQKPGPTHTRPPRFEIFALQHGANASYDVIGTTEQMDTLVDTIFRRTGHSARPPLTIRNVIHVTGANHMRSANASANASAISGVPSAFNPGGVSSVGLSANGGCTELTRALEGAPDPVFDEFATRSTADRALWEATSRQLSPAPLLPAVPIEAAYGWYQHRPPSLQSPKEKRAAAAANASDPRESLRAMPWWDAFHVAPSGSNLTEVPVCLRERLRVRATSQGGCESTTAGACEHVT